LNFQTSSVFGYAPRLLVVAAVVAAADGIPLKSRSPNSFRAAGRALDYQQLPFMYDNIDDRTSIIDDSIVILWKCTSVSIAGKNLDPRSSPPTTVTTTQIRPGPETYILTNHSKRPSRHQQ